MLRSIGVRVARHLCGNLVAYIALFVALGGSAVAAAPLMTGAKIQDGTISSADLRDRDSTAYPGPSIQGVDIEADGITGQEVDESTLSGVDAATLDGKDSTDFLGATAKASDADKLDGLDATALQSRVTGICAPGTAMTAVEASGAVSCGAKASNDVAMGHVASGGTVTFGTGGLVATQLDPTTFLLSFSGFDPQNHYAVFGQPFSHWADPAGSTFEVIPSTDPDLATALGGNSFSDSGIVVRARRPNGTALSDGFFVRIAQVGG
jgi:hypothetical protein